MILERGGDDDRKGERLLAFMWNEISDRLLSTLIRLLKSAKLNLLIIKC